LVRNAVDHEIVVQKNRVKTLQRPKDVISTLIIIIIRSKKRTVHLWLLIDHS